MNKKEGSLLDRVLSDYGKRSYFPKGVVMQSQQAGKEAFFVNATAGVALEKNHYVTHPQFNHVLQTLSGDQIVSYAPTSGDPVLRALWKQEMVKKNPLVHINEISDPIITTGLTHALYIASQLFVNPGDTIFIPSPCWDNYELIFHTHSQANVEYVPLFDTSYRWNTDNFSKALHTHTHKKMVVLLNFPHNPTGYSPTESELKELVNLCIQEAERGKDIVVIIDDAYAGLYHTEDAYPYSPFGLLSHAHENIVAIKCDAATKEALVWGFRVGFITYGSKAFTSKEYDMLDEKTKAVIRSSISSSSRVSQSLLIEVMKEPSFSDTVEHVKQMMRDRFLLVQDVLHRYKNHRLLHPYPSNSGYFCTFHTAGDAHQLREYLLKTHGLGVVALSPHLIRFAYSAVDEQLIERSLLIMYESSEFLWQDIIASL